MGGEVRESHGAPEGTQGGGTAVPWRKATTGWVEGRVKRPSQQNGDFLQEKMEKWFGVTECYIHLPRMAHGKSRRMQPIVGIKPGVYHVRPPELKGKTLRNQQLTVRMVQDDS